MKNLKVKSIPPSLLSSKKFMEFTHRNSKKRNKGEFKKILDAYMVEAAEDFESGYRFYSPHATRFHDNGYEDLERY